MDPLCSLKSLSYGDKGVEGACSEQNEEVVFSLDLRCGIWALGRGGQLVLEAPGPSGKRRLLTQVPLPGI